MSLSPLIPAQAGIQQKRRGRGIIVSLNLYAAQTRRAGFPLPQE